MTESTLSVRVARRRDEADGIASFEFVSADGRALPAFEAGAHIDVHVPGGLVRQYSLCNAPSARGVYQIAVLRDPASRGGSTAMHDAVHEGALIDIGVPRNHFPIVGGDASHLLLAGGIGVTPLLCMAEQLASAGAPFSFHYCARSRSRAAFVERIAGAPWAAHAHFHFDDDERSRLDLKTLLANAPAGQHLYVCGPQGFIDAVLGEARAAGWPEARLHREYFGAAPVAGDNDDDSFEVELASTGKVVPVPCGVSVTQALLAVGVDVPVSCEQGICGTCITRVIDGEPDHRDLYLSPQEQARNDQFLPCCSRAKSRRLVLDL